MCSSTMMMARSSATVHQHPMKVEQEYAFKNPRSFRCKVMRIHYPFATRRIRWLRLAAIAAASLWTLQLAGLTTSLASSSSSSLSPSLLLLPIVDAVGWNHNNDPTTTRGKGANSQKYLSNNKNRQSRYRKASSTTSSRSFQRYLQESIAPSSSSTFIYGNSEGPSTVNSKTTAPSKRSLLDGKAKSKGGGGGAGNIFDSPSRGNRTSKKHATTASKSKSKSKSKRSLPPSLVGDESPSHPTPNSPKWPTMSPESESDVGNPTADNGMGYSPTAAPSSTVITAIMVDPQQGRQVGGGGTGTCELDSSGFYGVPQGLVYEVDFVYQVIVQAGTQPVNVLLDVLPDLDRGVAAMLLPYLFQCSNSTTTSTRRLLRGQSFWFSKRQEQLPLHLQPPQLSSRTTRYLQTNNTQNIYGISSDPQDQLVLQGLSCLGSVTTDCYVVDGAIDVFASGFNSLSEVADTIRPLIQQMIDNGDLTTVNSLIASTMYIGATFDITLTPTRAPVVVPAPVTFSPIQLTSAPTFVTAPSSLQPPSTGQNGTPTVVPTFARPGSVPTATPSMSFPSAPTTGRPPSQTPVPTPTTNQSPNIGSPSSSGGTVTLSPSSPPATGIVTPESDNGGNGLAWWIYLLFGAAVAIFLFLLCSARGNRGRNTPMGGPTNSSIAAAGLGGGGASNGGVGTTKGADIGDPSEPYEPPGASDYVPPGMGSSNAFNAGSGGSAAAVAGGVVAAGAVGAAAAGAAASRSNDDDASGTRDESGNVDRSYNEEEGEESYTNEGEEDEFEGDNSGDFDEDDEFEDGEVGGEEEETFEEESYYEEETVGDGSNRYEGGEKDPAQSWGSGSY